MKSLHFNELELIGRTLGSTILQMRENTADDETATVTVWPAIGVIMLASRLHRLVRTESMPEGSAVVLADAGADGRLLSWLRMTDFPFLQPREEAIVVASIMDCFEESTTYRSLLDVNVRTADVLSPVGVFEAALEVISELASSVGAIEAVVRIAEGDHAKACPPPPPGLEVLIMGAIPLDRDKVTPRIGLLKRAFPGWSVAPGPGGGGDLVVSLPHSPGWDVGWVLSLIESRPWDDVRWRWDAGVPSQRWGWREPPVPRIEIPFESGLVSIPGECAAWSGDEGTVDWLRGSPGLTYVVDSFGCLRVLRAFRGRYEDTTSPGVEIYVPLVALCAGLRKIGESEMAALLDPSNDGELIRGALLHLSQPILEAAVGGHADAVTAWAWASEGAPAAGGPRVAGGGAAKPVVTMVAPPGQFPCYSSHYHQVRHGATCSNVYVDGLYNAGDWGALAYLDGVGTAVRFDHDHSMKPVRIIDARIEGPMAFYTVLGIQVAECRSCVLTGTAGRVGARHPWYGRVGAMAEWPRVLVIPNCGTTDEDERENAVSQVIRHHPHLSRGLLMSAIFPSE